MLADFSMLECSILHKLHSTYCMNLYGIELCNYNDKSILSIFTAWRKVMRRLFKLEYRTHIYIINNLVESITIKLDRRLAKFVYSLLNSDNKFVTQLVGHKMFSSGSIVAENHRYLSYKYYICQQDWTGSLHTLLLKIKPPDLCLEQLSIVSAIKQLIT